MATDTLTLDTSNPATLTGEEAFVKWKIVMRAIEGGNPEDDDRELWTEESRLEDAIFDDAEASPRAAERKLWIALQHTLTLPDDNTAVIHENPAPLLAKGEDLDWNVRLIISAIQSLRITQGRE